MYKGAFMAKTNEFPTISTICKQLMISREQKPDESPMTHHHTTDICGATFSQVKERGREPIPLIKRWVWYAYSTTAKWQHPPIPLAFNQTRTIDFSAKTVDTCLQLVLTATEYER